MIPLTNAIAHAMELHEKLRRLRWRETHGLEDLVYRGPPDFVLRHGTPYEWRPLPEGIRTGAPRACFGNVIALVSSAQARGLDWHYVEGFALDPGRSRTPILHAWAIDDAGLVIDPTWWRVRTDAYLGVTFSVERADDATWNGDACVLDDWQRGWPIFKQPWEGEDFTKDWGPNPRLELLAKAARGEKMTEEDRRIIYEEDAE